MTGDIVGIFMISSLLLLLVICLPMTGFSITFDDNAASPMPHEFVTIAELKGLIH
jgi:hypothetical protein